MGAAEDEVAGLWRALYGEPPAIQSDFRTMLSIVVATLPEPPHGAPPGDGSTSPESPAPAD